MCIDPTGSLSGREGTRTVLTSRYSIPFPPFSAIFLEAAFSPLVPPRPLDHPAVAGSETRLDRIVGPPVDTAVADTAAGMLVDWHGEDAVDDLHDVCRLSLVA